MGFWEFKLDIGLAAASSFEPWHDFLLPCHVIIIRSNTLEYFKSLKTISDGNARRSLHLLKLLYHYSSLR